MSAEEKITSYFSEIFSLSRVYGDNKRPFVYFEVIDLGGEPIKNTDYTWMARVSEFRYGMFLSDVVRKNNGQKLKYLNNFGTGNDQYSTSCKLFSFFIQAGE